MIPPIVKFWLTILCGFLAIFGLVAAWLASTTFTDNHKARYPFLKKLVGKKFTFQVIALIFGIIGIGITTLQTASSALETVVTANGTTIQKATESGFDKEAQDAADELKKRVKEYFSAGEQDFAANNYRSAATNFKASIAALPTMAAYLNAGFSLNNISDYPGAQQAYEEGLLLAQRKGDKSFQAAFLDNIGIVDSDYGKLDEALNYQQQALNIDKAIGNQIGQATDLNNIGMIYKNMGKFDEALNYFQQALAPFKMIGATAQVRIVEANINKIKARVK